MGTALGVTFFQIFRYLYISSKAEAAPLVKGTTASTEEKDEVKP